MNRSCNPPCIIFAYNRPVFLQQILNRLKDQNVKKLIIFIDGPQRPADQRMVEACRSIAEEIRWADTHNIFHDQNKGLVGITDNINKVFQCVDEAIFLEDDCLPMPSFYDFMCEAISRYRDDENLFSIGAYQPVNRSCLKNHPYSVVVSPRFMCWGWASWKHKWRRIDSRLPEFMNLFDGLVKMTDIAGKDLPQMARACAAGTAFSWAVQVSVVMLWLEKFQLLPAASLIKNIGMGTGTHRGRPSFSLLWRKLLQQRNLYASKSLDLNWPDRICFDREYAKQYQRFIETIHQPVWRQVGRFMLEECQF